MPRVQQVLHQAGFDSLLFGDQGFGLFNRLVNGGEDFRRSWIVRSLSLGTET